MNVSWQRSVFRVAVAMLLGPTGALAAANLIRGPYLQAATTNGIAILAECDSTSAITVEYGLTTSYGSSNQTAATAATTRSPASYVHTVSLTGLAADTDYHYRLKAGNTTTLDATFHTLAPPGTDFRFAWMADCRTGTSVHDAIATQIFNATPLFSLYGGDLCNSSSYTDFTNEFWRANELALDAFVPFFNSVGNHETWGQNTQAFTENPASASGTQDYYSFDCGDLHVLVLNFQLSYAAGSAQYNFATNDLATSGATWKIVTCHEPAYACGGNHTPSADIVNLATNCFEKTGVDVMLSGHIHFYEHILTNQVHYFIIGSAGAPLVGVGSGPSLLAATSSYCYAMADVTYTSLNLVVYSGQGDVLDSLSLAKAASPVQLAFVAQPAATHAGAVLTPLPQLALLDIKGNTAASATNPVAVALTGGPPGAALTGTLALPAVNGIASFNDLRIDIPGTGYRLVAWADGLPAVTSGVFNVQFADANGNGIADNWESAFFFSSNVATNADADGDGRSNLAEFIAGTDPTNAVDNFVLHCDAATNQLVVWFTARAATTNYWAGFDRYYALEISTNLPAGGWTPVPDYDNVLGANQCVAYTNSLTGSPAFYRARVWLRPW